MGNMNKPKNFKDLLELQQILDNEVSKPRKNGFVPRIRDEIDIILSIDDEFQEWLKELPYEINFKTWKQKEYSRKKELEELTDILFFFLQYCNHRKEFFQRMATEIKVTECEKNIIEFSNIFDSRDTIECNLRTKIQEFKHKLYYKEVIEGMSFGWYMDIVLTRGFTKEDLLETYWKKWNKNMERINKDWVITRHE